MKLPVPVPVPVSLVGETGALSENSC